MRFLKFNVLTLALLLAGAWHAARAQSNPVLEGVADAGVINFNGKYYIAGVATNGGYYVSSDLVKWTGPVHVFSMNNDWIKGKPFGDNQIHAADINYFNGKFHFFWSANYWGARNTTVHIGHAVSDKILGLYIEPNKKTWFDDRIDPAMFMDSDSTFYLYSVKFTDGNTIWGQQLKDPWTFKGEPKLMFNSLPETWERVDNNVTEGPWVMKYRSRYFMMYNANHTANSYGNYALGVAETDHPLGFNSANKYPHPVVQQNLSDNPDEMKYLFTSSTKAFTNWKYITTDPGAQWAGASFEDGSWSTGDKGFGNQVIKGSTTTRPQTTWNSDDIWVRKRFSFTNAPSDNLELFVNHAGASEVYIDGQLVYKNATGNYTTAGLDKDVISKLKTGEHVIALHSKKGRRAANIDVDLIDPINKPGDDILLNPGQPNILKGPNGMEWWLIYFGMKNGGRRGQFVNRVIFNDHELTVDGPTGSKTPGYHPDPSQPVFGDIFDYTDVVAFKSKWDVKNGQWKLQDSALVQTDAAAKVTAFVKGHKAGNYLFKAGVKGNATGKSNSGIVAYYANPSNLLEIGLNKAEGVWYSRLVKDGKETIKKNKLASVFNFGVFHSLSVYKNDKRFDVLIDDNPAPGSNKIYSSFTAPGIAGIFTQNSGATFDGVIYTPGWDEYNTTITGWNSAQSGGMWKTTPGGLTQSQSSGGFAAFKGDKLGQYEFGTQVYRNLSGNFQADKGVAGIYPVYADQNNYLQAGLDFRTGKLVLSGQLAGNAIASTEVPLKRKVVKYPDPKHGDGLNKFYNLKEGTELTSLELVKSVYKNDFAINAFDSLKVFYRNKGEWYPLEFKTAQTGEQNINKITFTKITADAIRLVSAAIAPQMPNIYKLYVTEEKTSDYNLRTVKLKDRVIVFLDGKQVAEVKGSWPASQVGLFGKDAAVSYNGVTLFEK